MTQLGILADGTPVYDRYKSHLHIKSLELLEEALSRVERPKEKFSFHEVEFSHVIGKSYCVVTRPNDIIFYAKRVGRNGHTRFVLGREPEDTKCITIILLRSEGSDHFVLITAFLGNKAEAEPWDPKADEEAAREFWSSHALIALDDMEVIQDTFTIECPW